ncbi:putative Short chain dehydrogenase [Seiridium cardinale]|uniref:Short chain dehydrogenase n=1 Tax=Seiridium cardinale TaxID=138064 RepID=A0ABR2Y9G7_9PEZI
MTRYDKLAGQHVVIIGGTKGIGRSVAIAAAEAGAHVSIIGATKASADATTSEIISLHPPSKVTGYHCDLGAPSIENDLETLFSQLGEVNHLIYTATNSLPSRSPVQQMTAQSIDDSTTRLVAILLAIKVASRYLVQCRRSSVTLTTGSIADQPQPGCSLLAYAAQGLVGLTRALALDLKPIRVNIVEPGFVLNTGLWAQLTSEELEAISQDLAQRMPTGSPGAAEDVAEAYLYCMKDHNCTGETIKTRSGQHLV